MNIKTIKSSKVGMFSDIHIGLGQDSSIWHNNILEFADWVVDLYDKRGISEIIIPGDIFHNRNEISVNTLSIAKDFFEKLSGFQIYISTGNHDCYYKDRTDINSISLLGKWNNITLIDKEPKLFRIAGSEKILSMIPWGIEPRDIPTSDICIGHFEITSFKMNTFKICEHGLESKDLFQRSPYIISGHFHNRTYRKYDRGEILYLGSPYQQNFGDVNSDRGVYIFDLLTNEYEFIENTISPSHQKIFLSSILDKKIDSNYLKKIVPGNMISFVIDSNITSDKISLISSKIQKLNPKFFRTDYQNTDFNISLSATNNQYDSINIPQNINDFIEALDVSYKSEIGSYLNELYHKIAV
jgi:DNA repair exonuclease SbcCD nuclease subunit